MKKRIFGLVLLLLLSLSLTKPVNVAAEEGITVDTPEGVVTIEGLNALHHSEYEVGTSISSMPWVSGVKVYNWDGHVYAEAPVVVDYSEVDVDTVGVYNVHYKLQVESKLYTITTIEIMIVDTTPPIFSNVRDIVTPIGIEPNYLQFIQVSDNYDLLTRSDIRLILGPNADINQVGMYHVNYFVEDSSGNIATAKARVFVVEPDVVDARKPEILNVSELYIQQNHHDPDFLGQVEAYDEVLGDITEYIEIADGAVDLTRLGSYPLYYIVSSTNGNLVIEQTWVHVVVDDEAPEFVDLEDFSVTVHSNTSLKAHIKAIDKVCGDVSDRIQVIKNNFDINKLGVYQVTYVVYDLNGNRAEATVNVRVVDDVAPTITIKQNVIDIKVNSMGFTYHDNFVVSDNFDQYSKLQIDVNDGGYHIGTPGSYLIMITATDQAGNRSRATFMVNVFEHEVDRFTDNPAMVGASVGVGVCLMLTFLETIFGKRRRK